MTPKEIKALFPIEITITDEHRQSAIEKGGPHKLGTTLLEEILPDEHKDDIFWGLSIGSIQGILLKTEKEETYNGKKIKIPLYLDKNFIGNKIKFELR